MTGFASSVQSSSEASGGAQQLPNFDHVYPTNYYMAERPKLVSQNGRSYYSIDGNRVHRITEVLSSYKSEGLTAWRERVGNEVADLKCQVGIKRGTDVHALIEAYLNNSLEPTGWQSKLSANRVFEYAKPSLDRISMIHGTELPVYSRSLNIAGTLDCCAEFDGVMSIIDFKTSERPKRMEWCEKYFLQETFYSLCWEEMTESPVEQLVTLVICETGDVQVIKQDRDTWVLRLEDLVREFHHKKSIGVRK